jgi:hypothetical protein
MKIFQLTTKTLITEQKFLERIKGLTLKNNTM